MNDPSSHYLGIDIGTSGVRAVCAQADMRVRATASVMFHELDGSRRDPFTWSEAVSRVIASILSELGPQAIKAIAVDGTSGTTLAVDEQGTPVTNAMMYNDACSNNDILAQIKSNAPRTSAAHGTTSGLAKAIELSRLKEVAYIQHEADWVAYLLSGVPGLSDENNALKTGYDPVSTTWPEWIDSTEMNRSKLPKVYKAGQLIGPAHGPLALKLGLSEHTKIVAGTTDGCASFLATGAEHVGDGVTVLGSTLTIKLLSASPIYAPEYGIYSHKIGNTWLAGGASNTGGQVLAEYFKPDELSKISTLVNADQPTGLDYYPLIGPGERFPLNDPSLQPRLTPRPASDSQFLQAILEGMTAIETLGYQRLNELGGPVLKSIRTVGGGAGNQAWTQLRCKALAVPFLPSASDQAALGAAILARRGVKGI